MSAPLSLQMIEEIHESLLGMLRDVIGGISDDEWTARAYDGALLPGFLAWHICATFDWAIHAMAQSAPEVRAQTPFADDAVVNPPHPPFGMDAAAADAIAQASNRDAVLRYLEAVFASSAGYVAGLDEAALLTSCKPDHALSIAAYATDAYREEVASLAGRPLYRLLLSPCYGHVREHMGELLTIQAMLRAD